MNAVHHDHHPAESGIRGSGHARERKLLLAFGLTAGMMVVEALGGWWSGSLALLADAGHMLVDAVALLLAWGGAWLATRPADARRSYGYGRMEVLAGFVNALSQLLLVGWIIYEAISRIRNPHAILPGLMLVVACAGLLVNAIVLRMLHGHAHDDVNMAGAAVIAAIANAVGGRDFPFVFGGDGASFAVSSSDAGIARQALAETATWVREDLDLTLRVGMVSVEEIRRNGHDVRVGRYAVSDNISIAMFSGGGVAWADAAMKRDEISVPRAPAGARPDLSGLSCRFEQFPTQHGQILSVLVLPADIARMSAFRTVVRQIIDMAERSSECGRPIVRETMQLKWPAQGRDLEALASRSAGESASVARLKVYARTFLYFLIMRLNLRVGRFVPRKYLSEVAANSDFRKFDDALRMIIDCSPGMAQRIEDALAAAESDGHIRYGCHRENAAIMTCFTPLPSQPSHVHFIDGAEGGYALAAAALKQRL